MTYRTTTRANQDIIDLYVAGSVQFGMGQADKYHLGLLQAFDLLAANPFLARLRPEYDPPTRLYRYRAHMIAYVEDEAGILVVRVLHGRQDWESALA